MTSRIRDYVPALDVQPDAMHEITTAGHYQYVYVLPNGRAVSVVMAKSQLVMSSPLVIGGTYEVATLDQFGELVNVQGYLDTDEVAAYLLAASAEVTV